MAGLVWIVVIGALAFGGLILFAARRQAAAAQRWEVTEGQVFAARVESYRAVSSAGRTRAMYRPNIAYTYEVDGRRYAGSRVALGAPVSASSAELVNGAVQRFPAGTMVKVHYNPRNPSECVLEPNSLLWILAAVFGAAAYAVASTPAA